MKKFLLFSVSLLIILSTAAQGVKIGDTSGNPDASAGLEISFSDKGLLPPRVALSSIASFAPLSGHVEGMVVYNTATDNDVTPGLYVNDGTKWIRLNPEMYVAGDGIDITNHVISASGGSGADCITLPTQTPPEGYYYTGFSQLLSGNGMWWTTKANYPKPRKFLRSVTYNNEIYVFGHPISSGSSSDNTKVYKYNPSTNIWTNLPDQNGSMNYDRYRVEQYQNKAYFIAGIQSSSCGNANVWEYDFSTGTYTQKTNMPASRYQHATAIVGDKIYSFGGQGSCCGGCYTANTYEYNITADTWATKANMPVSMYGQTAAVYNGKVYLFGGSMSGESASARVYEYNPVTNTFAQKANMPTGRADAYALTYNDEIYVFGGSGLSKVEVYSPTTNTWRAAMDMPEGRGGMGGGIVNNKMYIIGGDTYYVYNNTWEYSPGLDTGPYFFMHCKE